MRVITWNTLALISALLCSTTIALWVRGHFVIDVWASHLYAPAARTLDSHLIVAANGWLVSTKSTTVMPPGARAPLWNHPMDSSWSHVSAPLTPPSAPPSPSDDAWLVFWRDSSTAARPASPSGSSLQTFQVAFFREGGVRLMGVIAVSSALPALWVLLRIRARRRAGKAGCCPVCGYDLRASPLQCPECGRMRSEEPQGRE